MTNDKLLIAVECKKIKRTLDNTMRWVSRGGFPFCFFVPRSMHNRFMKAIEEDNYQWYLAMEEKNIDSRRNPMEHAKQNGYGLILYIPDNLPAWRKGTAHKPAEILHYGKAIHAARAKFNKDPKLNVLHFANGSVMRRVV